MADRSTSPLIWIAAALAVFLFLRHNDIGRQAPDFALRGAYGGEYRLDSFRGRPVLLVFWNTNCGICRHELPILDSLYSEAARDNVEIACVNIGDMDGAREVMRPFRLLNLVDPDGSAARSYGVSGVPRLVLIGADGKIKRSMSGAASAGTLRDWF
ncbi:MAG TPA: TlpA disulfide reductase family protein [Bryobacteraceae bacterium]|nr:TlpA disulfide reductase family protein [Bryobacteraceae bacterium]